MKWILVVSAFLGTDADPMLFATEVECVAAAEAVVEANSGFEWVDGPSGLKGWIHPHQLEGWIPLVGRSTVECVGADEESD